MTPPWRAIGSRNQKKAEKRGKKKEKSWVPCACGATCSLPPHDVLMYIPPDFDHVCRCFPVLAGEVTVLCTVYCVLCTVYCVLCTVYCVLCTVYCVLCTVYCVLCTVYCVLCPKDLKMTLVYEYGFIFCENLSHQNFVHFSIYPPPQPGILSEM